MKKILLLLDVLHSPAAILSSIVRLAKEDDSFIQVLFLHRAHFQADLAYPLSADIPMLEANEKADHQLLEDNLQLVRDAFQVAGLPFRISDEETLLDELLDNTAFSDLILADARMNLPDFLYAPLNISMKDLLTDAHCPLLLLRENSQPTERVVLAYDGHYSSIYAIKQFSYLFPELRAVPTFLLEISSREGKLDHQDYLKDWLPRHFENVVVEVLPGKASEILPAFINRQTGPTMVVMGAYGRTAVSRLFRQSLANAVIEKTASSLFITHE